MASDSSSSGESAEQKRSLPYPSEDPVLSNQKSKEKDPKVVTNSKSPKGKASTADSDAPTPPSHPIHALDMLRLGSTSTMKKFMAPVKQKEGEGDENEERGNWSNDLQFILACLGYAIGLGNVWRFPYMLYRHGGGFLAAYWILLILVAFPVFALELLLGQFASRGPIHIWRRLMPCLEGLGWATLLCQSLNSIYYNAVHAYAIFYMFSAIGSPWARCEDPVLMGNKSFNSPTCFSVAEYDACVNKDPDKRLYAKRRCYTGPLEVASFLSHLEDACLARDSQTRYGPKASVGDWECNLKFRLYANATTLAQHFGLPNQSNPYTASLLDACNRNLFTSWDSCNFKEKEECSTRSLYEQSEELRIINVNAKTEGWQLAWPRANCLYRLLQQSSHVPWSLPEDWENWEARKGLTKEELRKALALPPGAEPKPGWVKIGRLAISIGDYCKATFAKEAGMVNELGLPTAKCVRRAVDTMESFSSSEYLDRFAQRGTDIEDVSSAGISYQIVICLLVAWAATVCGLYKGPKWTGQIVYATALFPLVIIVITIIISIFLPNSRAGVKFYVGFEGCRMGKIEVWKDALSQIFFSLSVGGGGLMTLSSYNRFHNDIIKDSVIIASANCIFSFVGGFGVFGIVGYMAGLVNAAVPEVLRGSSAGLAFVVIAQATTGLVGGELFAFAFYFMLVLLALDTQFAGVEMILTFIYDEFPRTTRFRFLVTSSIACLFTCVGLPFSSNVGLSSTEAMDESLYGVIVPHASLLALIGITWIYGPKRILRDVQLMMGKTAEEHGNKVGNFFVNSWFRFYFLICWTILAPIGIFGITVFFWMGYVDGFGKRLAPTAFPLALGVAPLILCLLGAPLYSLLGRGMSFGELFRPTVDWGPALDKHRIGPDYAPLQPPPDYEKLDPPPEAGTPTQPKEDEPDY